MDSLWVEAAKASVRKHGSYQAARAALGRERNQSSWGTASYSFSNAVIKTLDQLHEKGEI